MLYKFMLNIKLNLHKADLCEELNLYRKITLLGSLALDVLKVTF